MFFILIIEQMSNFIVLNKSIIKLKMFNFYLLIKQFSSLFLISLTIIGCSNDSCSNDSCSNDKERQKHLTDASSQHYDFKQLPDSPTNPVEYMVCGDMVDPCHEPSVIKTSSVKTRSVQARSVQARSVQARSVQMPSESFPSEILKTKTNNRSEHAKSDSKKMVKHQNRVFKKVKYYRPSPNFRKNANGISRGNADSNGKCRCTCSRPRSFSWN